MGLGPFPVWRNVHIIQSEFVYILPCKLRATRNELGLFLVREMGDVSR